jgi:outer membrane protein OmpA-like peptidoglycan-associated protein
MVITLSGSVVFASNKATLLPGAREKLDDVADALKEAPDSKLVVEGHTDSRGSDALNQQLSQARADAVRAYLVRRGVDASQVQAVGMGENQPVDDNASAEGRANNRRVEIIVEQPKQKEGD